MFEVVSKSREYFKRFPELFDGESFLPPREHWDKLTAMDWLVLNKIEQGGELNEKDVKRLERIVKKIRGEVSVVRRKRKK